jgi:FMN-dependent NADH-azoreductase
MNTILFIEVSPRGKESASRAVADTLAARLSALYPSAKLVRHDLAADHPPHTRCARIAQHRGAIRSYGDSTWFHPAA